MSPPKMSLIRKLDEMGQRYQEIDALIADPKVASNPTQLVALSKEQGQLRSIVTEYRAYQSALGQLARSLRVGLTI